MNNPPTFWMSWLGRIPALLMVSLLAVLAGCVSAPRPRLNGGVYDGQAHRSYSFRSHDVNGLGFVSLDVEMLGNPTTPPIRFRYVWDTVSTSEHDSVTTNAMLDRVATVWQFSAQSHGGHFTVHVSSEYLVIDDASRFHREVSKRLLKEARSFFDEYTSGWDDSTGLDLPNDCWSHQDMSLDCCTPDIVSVELHSGSFPTHGGAAPSISFNFVNDQGRAREFTVSELFVPDSGWEKGLSDLCMGKVRHAEAVVNGTLTHFEPERLSRFTVTPKTLQIHLSPPPEVAEGEWVVDIPWSDLREYLRPGGPARFFSGTR